MGEKTVLILQVVQCICYIAGMLIMYMYKFSEYEALNLASYQRYLNMVFLSWCMMLLMVLEPVISALMNKMSRTRVIVSFVCMFALLLPVESLYSSLFIDTRGSIIRREQYEVLNDKIASVCDGDDRVYFISQETTGFDYWVSRFNFRPNTVNPNFSWSIGEAFYEGDIWTKTVTVEEWKKDVLENYDYVALYKVNDYFLKNFASIFENPETIHENQVYKVNKLDGSLRLCP